MQQKSFVINVDVDAQGYTQKHCITVPSNKMSQLILLSNALLGIDLNNVFAVI